MRKATILILSLFLVLALSLAGCAAKETDEHDHENNLSVALGEDAVWANDEMGGMPQPENTTIKSIIRNDGICGVTLTGMSMESAKAYAQKTADAGFQELTNQVSDAGLFFFAMKEDGANLMITFNAESGEAVITYTDSLEDSMLGTPTPTPSEEA